MLIKLLEINWGPETQSILWEKIFEKDCVPIILFGLLNRKNVFGIPKLPNDGKYFKTQAYDIWAIENMAPLSGEKNSAKNIIQWFKKIKKDENITN